METGRPGIRVGIDVGGTFTHAVALDAATGGVVGAVRVPTTHRAASGVAQGVQDALRRLLEETDATAEDVRLVAHSTTQATNALLEGDVARVGILAASVGRSGLGRVAASRSRSEADIGDVPLDDAGQKRVRVAFEWVDCKGEEFESLAVQALERLRAAGAEVIVASEAFSIEDPSNEHRMVQWARDRGLMATATSDISLLHGLKQRTRTAAVNGSILPKMAEAARSTDEAAKALGVRSPLMIVRSDGGIMSAAETERRPLLTILSGPAAGVAAALRYVRIADGVFVEVGGTSTDISAIVDAKPSIQVATTGGHRLYLRTLAVQTVGVAGGSMARLTDEGLSAIGPRSAHIAGLPYYSYALPRPPLRAVLVQPLPDDPDDYVALEDEQGRRYAFTLTCASRTLSGEIPSHGAEAIGAMCGLRAEDVCRRMVECAVAQVAPLVRAVAEERGLPQARLSLVGGGGGAEALVPHLGEALGVPHRICDHAAVVSAIGAAMAMVHEVIERHIASPSPEDVARIREEAKQSAVRLGAQEASVEVAVEVDSASGILRAAATGSVAMDGDVAAAREELTDEALLARAAEVLLREGAGTVECEGRAGFFSVYQGSVETRALLGLVRRRRRPCCVLDGIGAVRLQRADARVISTQADRALDALAAESAYGDAGQQLPPARIFVGVRVVDISGLAGMDQARTVAEEELSGVRGDAPVLVVIG